MSATSIRGRRLPWWILASFQLRIHHARICDCNRVARILSRDSQPSRTSGSCVPKGIGGRHRLSRRHSRKECPVGRPRKLFEKRYEPSLALHANYSVTSDGQRFVMINRIDQGDAPAQIKTVINAFEELRRTTPPTQTK
jgi:hypothetical protein